MPSILADTGPLVALVNTRERDHAAAAAFFPEFSGQLLTTWAVLTEATHLLPRHLVPTFLSWIDRGPFDVVELGVPGVSRISELVRSYRDRPMDFADATLVTAAERTGLREIISFDFNDFDTYRLADGSSLNNLLSRL